ncbi:MAG: phosphoribosylformylglycinamidine synthase subunit PurS [Ignavibacteria bacterium]|nr:phosphoribosylformylglycinamidine synthase subunit PurS [Bacteroidota bacterium]MSQ46359.1 phosphoribosylformylglycinamidine synthase subunit PurS [Ignavibacteria bacterium]
MNYKATIEIMLRETILDVQGKAVEQAIHTFGDNGINKVRVGKKITFSLSAETQINAENAVKTICEKLLANPVMEDFNYQVEQLNQN